MQHLCRLLFLVVACQVLAACSVGYYTQAAAGQIEVLRARQPLEQVLKDAATSPGLREQLLAADAALVFAATELGLPTARGYRYYADLGRPYVVWSVFAAPEFSLEPRTWCFPVAGCVAYRAWFSEERARAEAAALGARGEDVFVGGVPAYSTLGWLPDPLLNTMFGDGPVGAAGLIFHELAHRVLYVPGDTAFNEGFASFVEQEGVTRWLRHQGDDAGLCRFALGLARRARVALLLDGLRAELAVIYDSDMPVETRRAARAGAFAAARQAYAAIRAGWTEPPWFDGWFGAGLNNALLLALGTYGDLVPAFRALLAEAGGDLPAFYDRARELGRLPPPERSLRLQQLAARDAAVSGPPRPETCRNW